jgi:hypothetical protein
VIERLDLRNFKTGKRRGGHKFATRDEPDDGRQPGHSSITLRDPAHRRSVA